MQRTGTYFLRLALLACGLFLAACDLPAVQVVPPPAARPPALTPEEAARTFAQVVKAVEPVAESECRQLSPGLNCDFQIAVDTDRHAAPNAFQVVDDAGRPVLIFTIGLIASIDNADELAFIMSHEAAHHIADHLDRQRRNAEAGALVFGDLATLSGGSAADVARARELGAAVGARSYSKDFELEADRLGTIIAYRAGFDPLAGSGFFARIPDPGDRFLGTHPPNAERLAMVRRTVATLKR